MNHKRLAYVILFSMVAVILMMMAATVVEKLVSSEIAFSLFYHNPLFIALWAVAAISGMAYVFARKMQRAPMTLIMHLAFVVILLGAVVTHFSSVNGQVHLRQNVPANAMYLKDGSQKEFPFELTLTEFEIYRYPGSMAASDYRSAVEVTDGPQMDISMNHIGKYKGYRFYQANYDQDNQGSVLAVSYDPWGVGITYTGYLLLLVALLGFFFQKDTKFRQTLRKLSAVVAVLLLIPMQSFAKGGEEAPYVLPQEVASEFSGLFVYYNDRVAPFETQARDYCLHTYGKPSYGSYTSEQLYAGWLFGNNWWSSVKLFPIAMEESFLEENPGAPKVVWFSCNDPLPEGLSMDHWTFVRRTFDMLGEEVEAENWNEVVRVVSRIRKYQQKTAESFLPSKGKIQAEKLYNRISRPRIPFMASITLGLLLFVLAGIRISKGRKAPDPEQKILALVSVAMFIYLSLVLGLRWYVSGHVPFAGSYSVMMLMAWLTSLAMTLFYKKFELVQPLGFILAGFTMLVASLASAKPQITHLMPVLQSPLLSIHVLSMMISYTLFGLVALNGIMGLCLREGEARERLRDVSLVIIYPALFLLTFGIFLGAVWANVSWGSYWAWDPKETWALVTMLIYSSCVHGSSITAFRNPKFFHLFTVLSFIAVLITYFGVNLLLGGMHAYA